MDADGEVVGMEFKIKPSPQQLPAGGKPVFLFRVEQLLIGIIDSALKRNQRIISGGATAVIHLIF